MIERILVISDIHSNITALEAVLDEASEHGPYTARLCAGDIVGYGPSPNEVTDLVRRAGFVSVRGNHDRGVITGDTSGWNWQAQEAARINRELLTPKNLDWLGKLSNRPYQDPGGRFAMVHGIFGGAPEGDRRYEDVYLDRFGEFPQEPLVIDGTPIPLGIVGHTHIPMYGCLTRDGEKWKVNMELYFVPGSRRSRVSVCDLATRTVSYEVNEQTPLVVVNFGSVGQPRHGSKAASYGIIELNGNTVTLHFRNVGYEIFDVREQISHLRIPLELADRLSYGE